MFADNPKVMKFLYWEQASRDTIVLKKSYVDITGGDLIAGLLLSQIIYWHLPNSETGNTKLRVEKEGHLWIAKSRDEWFEEIRITAKQFDRASKLLADMGLIEKKLFKFNGRPIPHIRLIWENFLPKWDETINRTAEALSDMDFTQRGKSTLPKGENPFYTKGEIHFTEREKSLTEITTNITTNNTTNNISIDPSYSGISINSDSSEKENGMIGSIDEKILHLQNLISEKHRNKEIPTPIAKPLMIHTKRLIEENISIDEIEEIYLATQNLVNQYQFGSILSNVLYETKGKIRNIRALLLKAIKNYYDEIQEIERKQTTNKEYKFYDWLNT